jgi:hypothetical protein
MSDLKKDAEDLVIKVPGNWGDKRIQEEIDKVLSASANGENAGNGEHLNTSFAPTPDRNAPVPEIGMNKREKTVPVKLLYDAWLEADVRTPAGEVVDLPMSKAKELLAAGKAERADRLPGE